MSWLRNYKRKYCIGNCVFYFFKVKKVFFSMQNLTFLFIFSCLTSAPVILVNKTHKIIPNNTNVRYFVIDDGVLRSISHRWKYIKWKKYMFKEGNLFNELQLCWGISFLAIVRKTILIYKKNQNNYSILLFLKRV